MGQQALVQLAGEQGDAVHPGVVPEPVAGEANLAAAAGPEHNLIEVGPRLDGRFFPGGVRVPTGTAGASRGSRHETDKRDVHPN